MGKTAVGFFVGNFALGLLGSRSAAPRVGRQDTGNMSIPLNETAEDKKSDYGAVSRKNPDEEASEPSRRCPMCVML